MLVVVISLASQRCWCIPRRRIMLAQWHSSGRKASLEKRRELYLKVQYIFYVWPIDRFQKLFDLKQIQSKFIEDLRARKQRPDCGATPHQVQIPFIFRAPKFNQRFSTQKRRKIAAPRLLVVLQAPMSLHFLTTEKF